MVSGRARPASWRTCDRSTAGSCSPPRPVRSRPEAPLGRLADALAAGPDPRRRELDRLVSGPVLAPGSPGYGAARLVYNERFDGVRPLAVVRVNDAQDVQAVVRWARRTGVRDRSALGRPQLRRLVDRHRRRGRPGQAARHPRRGADAPWSAPGRRLIDVYAPLAAQGRDDPGRLVRDASRSAGSRSAAASGSPSRKLGTTSDNVQSLRIVTADGRLLHLRRRSTTPTSSGPAAAAAAATSGSSPTSALRASRRSRNGA